MTERDLFIAALREGDPAERAAYLDRACGGDAALRGRVEALLREHEQLGSFLESPAPGHAVTVADEPRPEGPEAVLGPYRLLEQIGEGGFGVVFQAEQTQPVRRQVALKVLKPGMDTRQVVARFEAERQALAIMDHPNIAKVFDGGVTPAGRPYFVMELVQGVPITDYCDRNRLTPRERLELFLPVCQAMQHAHQKGVIHRDLKPSNILVVLRDAAPVPLVIDFGIAKALGQELTDKSLVTGFAQMVGTPLYMSPEQAGQSGLDVDTRSDIYALGVLLYELLTGTTPFTKERFHQAGYDEIRRIIREEEPPRPSTRLAESKGALPAIAAQRRTEPARLTRLMRGEPDWIVMKSLEKDRNRRYQTANDLALDVQRYLHDEPVVAGPPTAAYRLRKFARRNWRPVSVAVIILALLVGGAVGTAVGLVRERRAKDTAEKRLAQIEKAIDILGSIFENLDPRVEEQEGRPLRAILADRLDQAAADLEGEAVGDPLVVARLQHQLGRTYIGLALPSKAEVLLRKALATREAELGPDDPLTLQSRFHQASALHGMGRSKEAIEPLQQAWHAQVKILGPDHLDTLAMLDQLGEAYAEVGKATEAVAALEQVRDRLARQLAEGNPRRLVNLVRLARTYRVAGKTAQSLALYETLMDIERKVCGDGHPLLIVTMLNAGDTYRASYKMRQALALYEKARDTALAKLGPEHPHTLAAQDGVAFMYRAYRRTPEAIALGERVREARLRVLGADTLDTLLTLQNLAQAYEDAGQLDKALPLYQQAAAGAEKLGFATPDAWHFVHNLCHCYEELGQFNQAEVWWRKWLAHVQVKEGSESAEYCLNLEGLGSNLLKQKQYAAAERSFRECLAILQRRHPEEIHLVQYTQWQLGAALLGQGKYAEAEPLLLHAYPGMSKAEKDAGHKLPGSSTTDRVTEALERLVHLYDAWGKPDEAARWRKELAARSKATEPNVKPKDK
jgi:serine/threonine protein kinase/tetratricopeptide (TPR) repeat protein